MFRRSLELRLQQNFKRYILRKVRKVLSMQIDIYIYIYIICIFNICIFNIYIYIYLIFNTKYIQIYIINFKLDFTNVTYLRTLGGTWHGSCKHFQKKQNIIIMIIIITNNNNNGNNNIYNNNDNNNNNNNSFDHPGVNSRWHLGVIPGLEIAP